MRERVKAAMAVGAMVASTVGVVLVHAPPAAAQVPGSNGKIVFVSNRHNGPDEIWTMEADGSSPVRLTNDQVPEYDPAWSPDGRRIAFTRKSAAGSRVWVMNADGSGQTEVGAGDVAGWTPDGSKITLEKDGKTYLISPDGSGLTFVTNGYPGTWSPDGSMIVVTRLNSFDDADLWRVNANGTGELRLTDVPGIGTTHINPQWSPDGTKIAFTRHVSTWTHEAYVMNADGTGATNLTPFLNGAVFDLAWSADGTKIVYDSTQELGKQIWTMNSDGTGKVRLTGSAANFAPDWQRVKSLLPEVVHGAMVFDGVAGGLTMTCPAGKVPVGVGGFIGLANGEAKLTEISFNDHNGVRVAAAPDQGFTSKYQINVVAVCAIRPPGYQIVRSPFVTASGGSANASAICPTGKEALAGGAVVVGGLGDVSIAMSGVPRLVWSTGLYGFTEAVAAVDRDGSTPAWWLQATAVCANPLADVRQVSKLSPMTSNSKQVVVSCDENEEMLSTGAEIITAGFGRTGEVILDDLSPTVDLAMGIFTGIEDPEIADAPLDWQITGYATCMRV